jgi:predicted lipoprotein with Yx(FWY)xxD motif
MNRLIQPPGRTGKLPTSVVILVAAASAAVLVAGCGGNNNNGNANGGPHYGSQTTPASTGSATLGVGTTDLGKVLVGANGRTVYLFEKDKGGQSSCNGACAGVWPPFTTSGQPKGSGGVDSAKMTTTKRADGKQQVVYGGHPLYYYAADTKAGDTKGEGLDQFGAEWYAVSPAGQKVEKAGS